MERFLLAAGLLLFLFSSSLKAQVHRHVESDNSNWENSDARGYITACAGSPSASPNIQQFTVSGNDLGTDMDIYAPLNFEVSLSPTTGYQEKVTLSRSSDGNIPVTTIYVRSASTAPVGNFIVYCKITTSGHTSSDPFIRATIYDLPTLNPVSNQTVLSGAATAAINFTGTANTFDWVNDTPGIGLAASGEGNIPSFTTVNAGKTPVTATITVTPVSSGSAYVPNYDDGTVSVINTSAAVVTGSIKVGSHPYGISVSPDGTRAFVTNQASNNVSVINTATNAVIRTIPVGSAPAGIAVNAFETDIYIANENDNTVSVINISGAIAPATIKVGVGPAGILISHSNKELYVSNKTSNTISVIDIASNSEITEIPVGAAPSGMALSPDDSHLYVADVNDNTIDVISTLNNTIISTIPAGFSTEPSCIALSPDGSMLYVTEFTSGTVSVFNTSDNTQAASINVGKMPRGITTSTDGTKVYVGNSGSNTLSVISTANNNVEFTIPVGSGPSAFGNFIKSGTGCTGIPVEIKIKVNPDSYPNITAAGQLSPLNTVYGTVSSSTVFTVSGANMMAGILVAPPPGFEVSTNDISFSGTVTVGASGTIAPTTVYIRLTSRTPVGSYAGNIILSSINAGSVNLAMPSSIVNPAPLSITANNATKYYGTANPVLTVTYSGFVNNDGPANLTAKPIVTTTAVTASPPGQYPISVSGAASPNYTIIYAPGVLTVSRPLVIPNTFTPNGDGINDTWDIKNLDPYPNCTVQVFNRYGENVYSSNGYGVSWDGTYRGAPLPVSAYYYIINLKNGSKPFSGFVAIIR